MRIVVASTGLGHVARGIEAWAEDLGAVLASRGMDVVLAKGGGTAARPFEKVVPCSPRDSETAKRWIARIPKWLGWRLGVGSGYEWEQTTFAWGLVRLLRNTKADLLHVQDPQLAWLIQMARRLGVVGTKTILAHGTEERPEFLAKIDYLQHLAPWHLESIRRAGVWKPDWTAIPNFIDTDTFLPGDADDIRRELGIPNHAIVVLTAAAIKRVHKRIDYLIDEFALVRERFPELPVWLIVAGGREKETDELVAHGTARLGDRVRFLVKFPRARMPDLYRAADIFTMASLFEMMPIALIEAGASGLPCIVHDHPIFSWMTGQGGVVEQLDQTGALANAITTIAKNRSLRDTTGIAARGHVVANFGKDRVVDRILDYYNQVRQCP